MKAVFFTAWKRIANGRRVFREFYNLCLLSNKLIDDQRYAVNFSLIVMKTPFVVCAKYTVSQKVDGGNLVKSEPNSEFFTAVKNNKFPIKLV